MSIVRYTEELSVGDEVMVEGKYELIPSNVINISSIFMQGKFCFVLT